MTFVPETANLNANPNFLPDSKEIAAAILWRAEPLRSDREFWQMFYGDMGVVPVTPSVGEPLGGMPVLLWDETVQPSGSYKSCGASFAVLNTDPSANIWTYSTGNHGTSVGLAAGRRGQKAFVAVPGGISPVKENRISATGAELVKNDPVTGEPHARFADAEASAKRFDGQPGYALIDPFGHPDVIAGQCKVGFEMVEALVARGLAQETVIIPVTVAGGGHITGVALPIWQAKQEGVLGPNIYVVGVQPEGADASNRGLKRLHNQKPLTNLFGGKGPDKDFDALAIDGDSLSPLTLAIQNDPDLVQGIYTVSKPDTGRSMRDLKRQLGKAVEPAAALPHAFAREFAGTWQNQDMPVTFLLPVSGANVSPETELVFERAAARGDFSRMSAAHLMRKTYGMAEILARSRDTERAAGGLAVLSGHFPRS